MATRGYEHFTPADVARIARKDPQAAKPSKYRSVKTVVDGVTFDSKKEAHRYQELKLMQHAGQIRDLRWQPRYVLFALVLDQADIRDANAGVISQRRHVVCEYVADFDYLAAHDVVGQVIWRTVVEDVKSPATRKKEVYRLKRKMMEAQYGIQIREV